MTTFRGVDAMDDEKMGSIDLTFEEMEVLESLANSNQKGHHHHKGTISEEMKGSFTSREEKQAIEHAFDTLAQKGLAEWGKHGALRLTVQGKAYWNAKQLDDSDISRIL